MSKTVRVPDIYIASMKVHNSDNRGFHVQSGRIFKYLSFAFGSTYRLSGININRNPLGEVGVNAVHVG